MDFWNSINLKSLSKRNHSPLFSSPVQCPLLPFIRHSSVCNLLEALLSFSKPFHIVIYWYIVRNTMHRSERYKCGDKMLHIHKTYQTKCQWGILILFNSNFSRNKASKQIFFKWQNRVLIFINFRWSLQHVRRYFNVIILFFLALILKCKRGLRFLKIAHTLTPQADGNFISKYNNSRWNA